MKKEFPITNESRTSVRHASAFSLIEILVAMALLSLIVLALMTVFGSTQNAFRASVTQTDVLEGGRATMDMVAADLKLMTPSGANNVTNFYVTVVNGFTQSLPATSATRDNAMEDVFFLSHENQTWTGIGFFVRTNDNFHYPLGNGLGNLASLYRFETNSRSAAGLQIMFDRVRRFGSTNSSSVSKLLDGVMGFKVRTFNTNGFWIVTNINNNISAPGFYSWGEIATNFFSGNALPMSVEIELAVLEDRAVQRVESLQTPSLQINYLASHAGQLHIFRQRVMIPNADPAAYR